MEYTKYNYRIRTLKKGVGPSWLFLPGGPGIGSEYLEDFAVGLKLPGSKYLIDFPKDGSNDKGNLDIKEWEEGLVDLVQSMPNSIIVSHSFAGMFCLTIPKLELYLKGLVLIGCATANSFFENTTKMKKVHNFPDLSLAFEKYKSNPSNSAYEAFWDVYKFYCFMKEEFLAADKIMDQFSYNYTSYSFIEKAFYRNYNSTYSPTKIPALTIIGERDCVVDCDVYKNDSRYNKPNIINKIIPKASHFPWVSAQEELQNAFNEFNKNHL